MKKASQIIFSVLFTASLVAVMLASLGRAMPEQSFYEKRLYHEMPVPTWQGVSSGKFFSELEKAFEDRLIFRDEMIAITKQVDLQMRSGVVSNYVMTRGAKGPILPFYPFDYEKEVSNQQYEKVQAELVALNEAITDYGGHFLYVMIPRRESYFIKDYGLHLESGQKQRQQETALFTQLMEQENLPFLNLTKAFQAQQMPLYYATDHHFNNEGAWIAYSEIVSYLQENTQVSFAPLAREDFVQSQVELPLLGSYNRILMDTYLGEDEFMSYLQPRIPIDFTRRDMWYDAKGEIFDFSYRDLQDEKTGQPRTPQWAEYSFYMGGDWPETVIETGREELSSVLIYGESFTNCLETILWTAFDEMRSLDLRHYKDASLLSYVQREKPDVVICLRNEGECFTLEGNGTTTEILPRQTNAGETAGK